MKYVELCAIPTIENIVENLLKNYYANHNLSRFEAHIGTKPNKTRMFRKE